MYASLDYCGSEHCVQCESPVSVGLPGQAMAVAGKQKGRRARFILHTLLLLLITAVWQVLRNLEERSLGKKLPSKPGRAVSLKEHLGWCYLGGAERLLRPVGHKISNQQGENRGKSAN